MQQKYSELKCAHAVITPSISVDSATSTFSGESVGDRDRRTPRNRRPSSRRTGECDEREHVSTALLVLDPRFHSTPNFGHDGVVVGRYPPGLQREQEGEGRDPTFADLRVAMGLPVSERRKVFENFYL